MRNGISMHIARLIKSFKGPIGIMPVFAMLSNSFIGNITRTHQGDNTCSR